MGGLGGGLGANAKLMMITKYQLISAYLLATRVDNRNGLAPRAARLLVDLVLDELFMVLISSWIRTQFSFESSASGGECRSTFPALKCLSACSKERISNFISSSERGGALLIVEMKCCRSKASTCVIHYL